MSIQDWRREWQKKKRQVFLPWKNPMNSMKRPKLPGRQYICKTNWFIEEILLLSFEEVEVKSCWLCHSDTKLPGPRLKDGNMRSEHVATTDRIRRITNEDTLKGPETEECISKVAKHLGIPFMYIYDWETKLRIMPNLVFLECGRPLANIIWLSMCISPASKLFMWGNTGKMLISHRKCTQSRKESPHFVMEQQCFFYDKKILGWKKKLSIKRIQTCWRWLSNNKNSWVNIPELAVAGKERVPSSLPF